MKFILAIIVTFSVLSKQRDPHEFQILAHENLGSEITQESFNFIVHEAYRLYLPEAAKQRRPIIIKTLDWQTPYFSAWANHDYNTGIYDINFWGGFARLPLMTKRAFIFTACHELGHVLGGTPRIKTKGMDKMSTEGQSDFFAAASCFKTFVLKNPNFLDSPKQLDPYAASLCLDQFDTREDEIDLELCFQTMQTAKDFTLAINHLNLEEQAHYHTPDLRVVDETLTSYPSHQCRMDIISNAALLPYTGESVSIKNLESRLSCWYKAYN